MVKRWLGTYGKDIGAVIIILVVAGLPRLLDLGIFLTADEKNWIGRSYEFVRAFKNWRFNDMLQTTHPGVTTLWLSGVSLMAKIFTDGLPFSFQYLHHFVKAAQLPIALINTVLVAVMYIWLRQLFQSRRLAAITALVIALDPFFIGYSRLVHVDALLASFLFLAVIATILYGQRHYSRNWLILAAICSSLALLSKAPAIFMVPFLLLVILVTGQGQWRDWFWWQQRGRDVVIWLLLVGLIFVIIWPAILWVPNPQGNILLLKRDLGQAAITPHHMTEDYSVNPLHYPAALVTRTTPPVLVLSLVCPVWLLVRRKGEGIEGLPKSRHIVWFLLAFIFFFVLMMTLGAKKGDRYILPVFLAIDTLAVIGLWLLSQELRGRARQILFPVLSVIIILYLVLTVWAYHPYAVAYSNPLLPDNLSQELGWGEGLDQVADWLNTNDPQAVVASWYPEELAAFTTAQVAHINAHEQAQVRYVVLYRNMFGRAPDHPANDFIDEYYKKRQPVFVAKVVGKEFAWVYAKRTYEQVIGELVPGRRVGQIVTADHPLVGVDIYIATYSGQANTGQLQVTLKEPDTGKVMHSWQTSVKELADNSWLTLRLPAGVIAEKKPFLVEIEVIGATADKAPTVRYTRLFDARPTSVLVGTTDLVSGAEEKPGDLAIRLRYATPNGEATEEDSKLLPDLL